MYENEQPLTEIALNSIKNGKEIQAKIKKMTQPLATSTALKVKRQMLSDLFS